jgi:RHS repeat-associated protein
LSEVQEWVRNETGTLSGTLTATYGYDNLYRLTSAQRTGGVGNYTDSYGYDLAGNRTSINGQAYTYDPANKYASLPTGRGFDYDPDGNLTEWMPVPGVLTDPNVLTWNAYSELTDYSVGYSSLSESHFAYNGMGKMVHAWGVDFGATNRFLIYDGDLLLGEVDPSTGKALKGYTWGATGLISECEADGNGAFSSPNSRWFVFGPQGETRALVNSSGTVLGTLSYNAYGEIVGSSGVVDTAFRYGGQWGYYSEIGMILCGYRWYDPNQGRWLSRDPIGYEGGPNLYEYCGTNPVMYADPLGLMFSDLVDRRSWWQKACDWVAKQFEPQYDSEGRPICMGTVSIGPIGGLGAVKAVASRSYVTYVILDKSRKVVYVGKASGKGTPVQALKKRLSNHKHYRPKDGDKPYIIDRQHSSDACAGAEQVWHDYYTMKGAKLRNIDSPLDWKRNDKIADSIRKIKAFFDEMTSFKF